MTRRSIACAVVVVTGLSWLASAASYGSATSSRAGEETSGFDDLKPPEPKFFLRPREIEASESIACNTCHAQVVAEWKDTAHALAWVDEEYREQLEDKKKPESCYGCHIPKPLMQAELTSKPPARDDERHLGIRCESCHLDADGAMLGPRGTPTAAHASRKSEAFIGAGSNALCISCHKVNIGPVIGVAKDFETSNATGGKSCVGCHLAPVERAFATAPVAPPSTPEGTAPNVAAEPPPPVRKGRSHALQTPRDPSFLARAFELSARRVGDATVVSIQNAAGHRVPGLIGPEFVLKAQALDAQGKVLAEGEIAISTEHALAAGETSAIHLNAAATSVHLTGTQHDARAADPVVFIDRTLSIAPH
jgi:nitrate/TMAO reductase-like tetraheme cytochrome c subunit